MHRNQEGFAAISLAILEQKAAMIEFYMYPGPTSTWNAAKHAVSPNYEEEGKYIKGWN